ncbi:LD-carboxypeptidase [Hyphomonas sp. BRH_c22]|uniref:LD-carboxypeptidase n=1 Tax=Hyphomonas sp. BRH_c22 TaxID=1629710 RepID=UPI000AF83F18|nr:LD-carboxypeptidase [Hyphomonas sp. BRH_c22]
MAQGRLRIGVVAPGRAIDAHAQHKVSALAAETYGDERVELIFHPQCFLRSGHFAGPDAARAAAFVEMANDPDLDAVWFARGGYGSCRLLEAAFEGLGDVARRKTFLGYSDTGSLLARLYRDSIGTIVHGPMPADITRPGGEAAILRALDFLLGSDDRDGREASTRMPGQYAAFNITVLANLIGTPWVPDLTGHVLMLEEVGEYHYSLDRMLFNITSNPGMRAVAGILLGRCSAIPENDIDFEATEEEIAEHWCARNAIPYLGRADIGHDVDNKIVVFGRQS